MSMREKMARGICARMGHNPDAAGYGTDQDGNQIHFPLWHLCLPLVDGALDALMEPTEGMMNAAVTDYNGAMVMDARVRNCFRSAILAAKDGK